MTKKYQKKTICKIEATDEEFSEFMTLKELINVMPSCVHPLKMERFSQLFIKFCL